MKMWKILTIGMALDMLAAGIPVLAYADDVIVEDDTLVVAEDDIETVSDLGINEGDIEIVSDLGTDEDIFDDSIFAAEDESVTDISGFVVDTDVLQAAAENGSCGANLSYTLDSEGKLTISGTGEMTDFSYELDEEEDDGPVSPFKQRDDIISIVISDGVTSIGAYAFPECSNLKSVTFPDSLTEIGSNAFESCTSLTSVSIPDSVTLIGNGAFGGCSNLKSATLPGNGPDIGSFTFYECSSLTSITIPEGTTLIGPLAFFGCSSLTSVSIPDSVTGIWDTAFGNCINLESITIPNSDTWFDEGVFTNCSKLTIYGNSDSSAERYAEENGIPFEILVICDHTYGDWTITTSATCTTAGEKTRTCSSCNETEKEIIPATGHNPVTDAAIPATTTSTGLTEGSHCSVCGTVLVAQQTIPMIAPVIAPVAQEQITVSKKLTIKKPSATKNKITVNWKHFKQNKKTKALWKKIKKVQVQCATDSAFTNIVRSTMVGKKKTKATIKGLAKKTTYYVRVRYYDGTGYSAWSGVKKVKTK